MAQLRGCTDSRGPDLDYTNITDAGLEHLSELGQLQKLELNRVKVNAEGVNRLRRARPDLQMEYKLGPAGSPDDPLSPDLEPKAYAPGFVPVRPLICLL
jgi:hypothetical protein